MATKVHISPRIVLSISSLYNDTNRIFMEYIDNSIDSADQQYFKKELGGYVRPIEIVVKIEGKNYKDGKVTISDNCFGITNFTKIVGSIGNSDKKAQAWTNGQFGYGIYSFMAACDTLQVYSKLEGDNAVFLPIDRKEFKKERQEDVNIPDPDKINSFPHSSGTIIKLMDFDKLMWSGIDIDVLKIEIERHFESILRRKNLTVKLVNADNEEMICTPFDYESIDGEIYENFIQDLILDKDGRRKTKSTIHLDYPVHIYLKMTNGQVIGKPPVFVSKGRRICEIKDVKSFKSRHKSDIWGHSNITGFVDLHDLLGPTIARNDFKNDKNSLALYAMLYQLEEVILDFVKQSNKQSEDRHYQQLEDVLNKALSKLARIDSMNYRTDYLSGKDVNLSVGGSGMAVGEDIGGYNEGNGDEIQNPGTGAGEEGVDGSNMTENDSNTPDAGDNENKPKNAENINESEFKGEEKRKSGFNIRISEEEPQIDMNTGKQLRSIYDGSRIIVYKNHPDFQARVRISHQKTAKLTERLISYLASEITVHYKDIFYKKMQDGQPEYDKKMFEGFVNFIYEFEDILQDFNGKNLSDFSN